VSGETNLREAERSVVGAALLDPESVRFSTEHITPDDFEDINLGNVFSTIVGLRASGLPVDPISVDKAARERRLRGVNAILLHDLMAATPTASNAGYYARIVREGAVRRRLIRAGATMQGLAGADMPLEEVMTAARGEWDAVRGSTTSPLYAKPLGDVLDGSDEYDWLIPDLIERMDRMVLTGGEGGGKSTWLRQLAILPAAGIHPTTFAPIAPVRTLVVDVENTERQWRRKTRPMVHKAKLKGSADPNERVHIAAVDIIPGGRLDLTTERDQGAIHRLIDEHEPDMLVIGPLYKLVPRAITNDDDAAPLITALDSLRARGIALLMEAHAGKGLNKAGDRDLAPRGSSALLGWPEFGFGLTYDTDDMSGNTSKVVRWRGDRDERAWPDKLVRGGEWPWTDDKRAVTPGWTPHGGM